jgi:hypothetical protein
VSHWYCEKPRFDFISLLNAESVNFLSKVEFKMRPGSGPELLSDSDHWNVDRKYTCRPPHPILHPVCAVVVTGSKTDVGHSDYKTTFL